MVAENLVAEEECKLKDKNDYQHVTIEVSRKRWIILFIYIITNALSSAQWIEYSIITNIIMKYYNVSSATVDWTAISFMLMWPILIFPSSFIIEKMGLRAATLIGAFSSAIGAGVKLFSIDKDHFYVVLLGQTIVAISQTFILNVPSKLAVTWFRPQEVSLVCSLGIFGLSLGTAISFVAPPIFVKDSDNLEEIGDDLRVMCWTIFVIAAPIALIVFFYFPKEPHNPPSLAMLEERRVSKKVTFIAFLKSTWVLFKNKGYVIHLLSYGCNLAIYSSVSTLLNQYVLSYFPGCQEDAGRMGLVMIVSGMVGSVLTGYILDKTHKFKETSVILYLFCCLGMGGVAFALKEESKLLSYLAVAIFGFFLSSYIPAGVEFATEITYPSPESTVMGILIGTSQLFGVIFTIAFGEVALLYGSFWSMMAMAAVLASGLVLTILTPNKLKRQAAFEKDNNVEFSVLPQTDKINSLEKV